MLPCRLWDCVLKCGDSDGAICHCSPNRIVTLVPANLNLNTRDGKLVFDKANNSKRLCVLFHHTQMRPSLSQPDPMCRDPLIQIIDLSWPRPLIGQFSVLQLSQSWSSSYQIVVPAPSSGWVARGCFQGKLSWDLSSFSSTHANLYLEISRKTIS